MYEKMEFGAETTEHKIWICPGVSFVWQNMSQMNIMYYWNIVYMIRFMFRLHDYKGNMKAKFFDKRSITLANSDITNHGLNATDQMIQSKFTDINISARIVTF